MRLDLTALDARRAANATRSGDEGYDDAPAGVSMPVWGSLAALAVLFCATALATVSWRRRRRSRVRVTDDRKGGFTDLERAVPIANDAAGSDAGLPIPLSRSTTTARALSSYPIPYALPHDIATQRTPPPIAPAASAPNSMVNYLVELFSADVDDAGARGNVAISFAADQPNMPPTLVESVLEWRPADAPSSILPSVLAKNSHVLAYAFAPTEMHRQHLGLPSAVMVRHLPATSTAHGGAWCPLGVRVSWVDVESGTTLRSGEYPNTDARWLRHELPGSDRRWLPLEQTKQGVQSSRARLPPSPAKLPAPIVRESPARPKAARLVRFAPSSDDYAGGGEGERGTTKPLRFPANSAAVGAGIVVATAAAGAAAYAGMAALGTKKGKTGLVPPADPLEHVAPGTDVVGILRSHVKDNRAMLKRLFARADKDRSNSLDEIETQKLVARIIPDVSANDFERFFSLADASGDGLLDYTELETVLIDARRAQRDAKKAFGLATGDSDDSDDEDGDQDDGVLRTKEAFKKFLDELLRRAGDVPSDTESEQEQEDDDSDGEKIQTRASTINADDDPILYELERGVHTVMEESVQPDILPPNVGPRVVHDLVRKVLSSAQDVDQQEIRAVSEMVSIVTGLHMGANRPSGAVSESLARYIYAHVTNNEDAEAFQPEGGEVAELPGLTPIGTQETTSSKLPAAPAPAVVSAATAGTSANPEVTAVRASRPTQPTGGSGPTASAVPVAVAGAVTAGIVGGTVAMAGPSGPSDQPGILSGSEDPAVRASRPTQPTGGSGPTASAVPVAVAGAVTAGIVGGTVAMAGPSGPSDQPGILSGSEDPAVRASRPTQPTGGSGPTASAVPVAVAGAVTAGIVGGTVAMAGSSGPSDQPGILSGSEDPAVRASRPTQPTGGSGPTASAVPVAVAGAVTAGIVGGTVAMAGPSGPSDQPGILSGSEDPAVRASRPTQPTGGSGPTASAVPVAVAGAVTAGIVGGTVAMAGPSGPSDQPGILSGSEDPAVRASRPTQPTGGSGPTASAVPVAVAGAVTAGIVGGTVAMAGPSGPSDQPGILSGSEDPAVRASRPTQPTGGSGPTASAVPVAVAGAMTAGIVGGTVAMAGPSGPSDQPGILSAPVKPDPVDEALAGLDDDTDEDDESGSNTNALSSRNKSAATAPGGSGVLPTESQGGTSTNTGTSANVPSQAVLPPEAAPVSSATPGGGVPAGAPAPGGGSAATNRAPTSSGLQTLSAPASSVTPTPGGGSTATGAQPGPSGLQPLSALASSATPTPGGGITSASDAPAPSGSQPGSAAVSSATPVGGVGAPAGAPVPGGGTASASDAPAPSGSQPGSAPASSATPTPGGGIASASDTPAPSGSQPGSAPASSATPTPGGGITSASDAPAPSGSQPGSAAVSSATPVGGVGAPAGAPVPGGGTASASDAPAPSGSQPGSAPASSATPTPGGGIASASDTPAPSGSQPGSAAVSSGGGKGAPSQKEEPMRPTHIKFKPLAIAVWFCIRIRRQFGIVNLDLTVFAPRRNATPLNDFFDLIDRKNPLGTNRLRGKLPADSGGATPMEKDRMASDWKFIAGSTAKPHRRLLQLIRQKDPTCRALRLDKAKAMQQSKAEIKALHKVILEYHTLLTMMHAYFSTMDSLNQSFCMTANEFNHFCTFLKIQDPNAPSDTVRPQDLQMCFSQSTFVEGETTQNFVTRHRFIVVMIRTCTRVFCAAPVGVSPESSASRSMSHALGRLIDLAREKIQAHIPVAIEYNDLFRVDRFYCKSVNNVLAKHLVFLRAVYVRYKSGVNFNLVPNGAGPGSFAAFYMSQKAFTQVISMMRILGGETVKKASQVKENALDVDDSVNAHDSVFGISRRECEFCFTRSVFEPTQLEEEGVKMMSSDGNLDCVGFFEALCRVADVLSPPPPRKHSAEDKRKDLADFFDVHNEALPSFPTWRFMDALSGPAIDPSQTTSAASTDPNNDTFIPAPTLSTDAHRCYPRPSRGMMKPKTRMVAEKLECLIELMYRGLCCRMRAPTPLYNAAWGDPFTEGTGTSTSPKLWVKKLIVEMEKEGTHGGQQNASAQAIVRTARDGTQFLAASSGADVDEYLKRHIT